MNKRFKSYLLVSLFSLGIFTAHNTQTGSWFVGYSSDDDGLLWGLGIAAGVTAGIAATYNAFCWSDEDIIRWAHDGVEERDAKYQQLNHYSGDTISQLQLFGNRMTTSWNWRSEIESLVIDNPRLAPLHNTLLIMQDDMIQLREYQKHLLKRNLTHHPRCQRINATIIAMLSELDRLSACILSCPDYTAEEQALEKKLHHIKQERLDRERNEALQKQARLQREQMEREEQARERERREHRQRHNGRAADARNW